MTDDLLSLLLSLDGVEQSRRYHPEGDALYHSLQAFELATRASQDRVLWAAALFHAVGNAIDGPLHDEIGADLLEDLLCPRVVWLVRHHLDLLKAPRHARRRFRGTPELRDLERLRRFDLGGRDPKAEVVSPEEAFDMLFATEAGRALLCADADDGSSREESSLEP